MARRTRTRRGKLGPVDVMGALLYGLLLAQSARTLLWAVQPAPYPWPRSRPGARFHNRHVVGYTTGTAPPDRPVATIQRGQRPGRYERDPPVGESRYASPLPSSGGPGRCPDRHVSGRPARESGDVSPLPTSDRGQGCRSRRQTPDSPARESSGSLPLPGDPSQGRRPRRQACDPPVGARGAVARPDNQQAGDPPSSRRRTHRGGRGAGRRRGRRGGVNLRRHGDVRASDLLVGHLNVQSLKPKLPDIRHDLHHTYNFDIFCLCETWLTPSVPDRLLNITGYNIFRSDRASNSGLSRGHGGVAVFVRDTLDCQIVTPNAANEHSNLESIWLSVAAAKQTFLIASMYRVPKNTSRQLTADIDELESQLQYMIAQPPEVSTNHHRRFELLSVEKWTG